VTLVSSAINASSAPSQNEADTVVCLVRTQWHPAHGRLGLPDILELAEACDVPVRCRAGPVFPQL